MHKSFACYLQFSMLHVLIVKYLIVTLMVVVFEDKVFEVFVAVFEDKNINKNVRHSVSVM